jgi:glycosyltransferase involved in cell wall biosynthesis
MFAAVRRRAAGVICVSSFTRDELLGFVPRGRAEPRVIHSGLDAQWFAPVSGGSPHPEPYLLYAGNVKPHKNLGVLLRAFAAIRDSVPHDLVLVGRSHGFRTGDAGVARLAAELGDRVVIRGEVPLESLRRYLAHAALFVTPSLYEGFGFPPLEAMASGCPCLVSNAGALPEICGDAAEYFDPRGADLGDRILRMLADASLLAALVRRGRARAASYDWEQCAAQTAGVLEHAMRTDPHSATP